MSIGLNMLIYLVLPLQYFLVLSNLLGTILAIREGELRTGLFIDNACPPNFISAVESTFPIIQSYLAAGLDALSSPNTAPFSTFFRPRYDQRPVRRALISLQLIFTQHTLRSSTTTRAPIRILCSDPLDRCLPKERDGPSPSAVPPGSGDPEREGNLAYASASTTNAYITICDQYFRIFPLAPDACNPRANTTISLVDTLLHELLHLPHVAGEHIQIRDIVYGEPRCEKLLAESKSTMATKDRIPSLNADSYMFYCRWAWLGGWGHGRTGQPCANDPRFDSIQKSTIEAKARKQGPPAVYSG